MMVMSKKTYSVSEFKAKSLGLIERVARTHESIIVTKRGKPIAEVIPLGKTAKQPVPGRLKDALVSEDDIVSPLGAEILESFRVKYLLDTHAWIWWNSKPSALSPNVLKLIQNSKYEELLLSSISVWEFSKLLEKRG